MVDIANGFLSFGKNSVIAVGSGLIKGCSEFAAETIDAINRLANSLASDLVNGSIDIVRGLYFCLRTSPISIDYVRLKIDSKYDYGDDKNLFPNYLDYCISKIHYGEREQIFSSFEEWQVVAQKQFYDIDKKREENIVAAWDNLQANPQQFSIDAISETTKLILYWSLCDVAASKVAQISKTFSAAIKSELQLLSKEYKVVSAVSDGVYDSKAIKLSEAPLISSLKSTEQAIHSSTKHGSKAV